MSSDVLQTAMKELQIEKNLEEIEQQWNSMRFQIHKQDRGFLISDVEPIIQSLEDSTLLLNSISSSRFANIYLSKVQQWIRTLSSISDVIQIWTIVQQKWLYLENIFISSSAQFGEETKRFETIDKVYRKIMLGNSSHFEIRSNHCFVVSVETSRNPLVKDACLQAGRYDELKSILNLIEHIQKHLNEYLDTKRQLFARFYFLSDDELLSIIGSTNPKQIQIYLPKMFENIFALDFTESMDVQGMISFEKEQLNFRNSISCQDKVEHWMKSIEQEMKESNRLITKQAIFFYRYKQSRLEWMRKYIGMVILAVNQIWMTWFIEEFSSSFLFDIE